ncbi:hypothetical protein N7486_008854 [Penicillium sp. IBT 16267x]|nr:hypothetical protein N7486_008854 [Penicillium sp. IBT 16267x]
MSDPEAMLAAGLLRKRAACVRCRQRKTRCDGQIPACAGCVKANVSCIEGRGPDNRILLRHMNSLQERVHWLESIVRHAGPEVALDAGPRAPLSGQAPRETSTLDESEPSNISREHSSPYTPMSSATAAAAADVPSDISFAAAAEIGPSQPLAHEVGLLSLGSSSDPKYLGPSSGVTFARLIFAAAPQTQGLQSSWTTGEINNVYHQAGGQPTAPLPSLDEAQYFVSTYFEFFQPLYPFLDEPGFRNLVDPIYCQISNLEGPANPVGPTPTSVLPNEMSLAQLFLVLSLGARVLEYKFSTDFSADGYLAAAMQLVARLQLHDSIPGIQTMLLLALNSLTSSNGLNAWFLKSTIIASCLDLGLQRKEPMKDAQAASTRSQVRSGIFWSAYSIERTLSTVLGRPLTLRDEAIDIEFPGAAGLQQSVQQREFGSAPSNLGLSNKRARLDPSPFAAAIYSFRFDQIVAEIKLIIYRVSQSPTDFPWPTDREACQTRLYLKCKSLLDEIMVSLPHHGSSANMMLSSGATLQTLKLKYYHCIMLIFRPSPAFPRPTEHALKMCFEGAFETIRIHAELHRFANMTNSWLTAHSVFVAGITMLYCLWVSHQVRLQTAFQTFTHQASSCSKLLQALAKTWSLAENARVKFDRLVQITRNTWRFEQSKSATITSIPSLVNEDGSVARLPPNGQSVADNLRLAADISSLLFEWNYDEPSIQERSFPLNELDDVGNWFDLDWLRENKDRSSTTW